MKKILDPCCGSRMFYFDKDNKLVHFNDIRNLETTLCDGRKLEIKPDTNFDCRNLPFESEGFDLIIFDPPHLVNVGNKSWLAQKYGKLVYEGDIIKWYESELKRIEEVFFDEKLVEYFIGFKDKLTRNFSTTAQKCKVIGNIHENPELLKGSEK